MNEKIKAIPLIVPPTDAFFPYVQRAETAATNAEAAAKRAEDAAAALPSPEDFGRFFVDASSTTGKVTLTRQSGDTVEVPISADSVANLRARQNSTAYSVGDVALWDGLPSWAFLVCRTPGISATAGNPITDGTVSWSVASIEAPATVANAEHANTADSATKLATARTINGVAFDGTSNITINAVDSTPRVAVSQIGQPNGVAGLGADGRVPADQLPSYVDDVLPYENQGAFPDTGESGKLYLAEDTNLLYRWVAGSGDSGGSYVRISAGAGVADSAVKLQTARQFSIVGGATAAGVAFDGTANVALNVTALDATKLTGMVPDASINIQAVSDEEIQALFD